jgi:hypothetical protein
LRLQNDFKAIPAVLAGNLKSGRKKNMRKYSFVLLAAVLCYACEGEVKVDEKKIDEAGDKLQKTVEKGADSLGAKLDRLEDKLDRDDTLKK